MGLVGIEKIMRPISSEVKKKLLQEPNICARINDGNCDGRITFEHSLIYAGRQIDEAWAIVKLCTYHHSVNEHQDGDGLDKQKNIWIALNRATDEELEKYSKLINYKRERNRLNKIYG